MRSPQDAKCCDGPIRNAERSGTGRAKEDEQDPWCAINVNAPTHDSNLTSFTPEGSPGSSIALTARRSRRVRDWRRALVFARRCSRKRSPVCGGVVEKFHRDGWAPLWPVGMEMLCYMLLTKPTIAGRFVCSRISSDPPCRKRLRTGSGIGKSYGKNARQLVVQDTRLSLVLSMEPRVGADLCKDEQQRGHRSSYLYPSTATLAQAAWFLQRSFSIGTSWRTK